MIYALFWIATTALVVGICVGAYFLVKRLFTHERYYQSTKQELNKVRKDIDKLKK